MSSITSIYKQLQLCCLINTQIQGLIGTDGSWARYGPLEKFLGPTKLPDPQTAVYEYKTKICKAAQSYLHTVSSIINYKSSSVKHDNKEEGVGKHAHL